MKKFIIVLLLITVLLCSCSDTDVTKVSGEAGKSTLSRTLGDTLYVANANSKTYHLPSCYIAKNMKAENRYETKDYNFLVEREYKPCKKCIDTNTD